MRKSIDDVQNWRDRAVEARAAAAQVKDAQARTALLRIAESYDELAERAAKRQNGT
jgi:hypothetical protein